MTKLLPAPVRSSRPASASIARFTRIGLAASALLLVGLGGWGTMAQINGAVIAHGQVVVAGDLKRVQHSSGGIIGAIYVQDGDKVRAGDLLVRMDDTILKAQRDQIDSQLVALATQRARLEAEREYQKTVVVPKLLEARADDPAVAKAMQDQQKTLDSENQTMTNQIAQLKERIQQLKEQVSGYAAQRDAMKDEIAVTADELSSVEGLYKRGLTPQSRLNDLRRTKAQLDGQYGSLVATVAATGGKINETELQILQITRDQRDKTLAAINDVEPKIADLLQRLAAAEFQLSQVDVRAPYSGYVHELAVHTVGGVVQPGETLMEIVPEADQLLVEGRISPTDIDQVTVGQPADVVPSAFNHRTTPHLEGHVVMVSPEVVRDDKTGATFYTARVAFDPGQVALLHGQKLVPGMPAEIYIETGSQRAIAYFLKPLTDQVRHTFREG